MNKTIIALALAFAALTACEVPEEDAAPPQQAAQAPAPAPTPPVTEAPAPEVTEAPVVSDEDLVRFHALLMFNDYDAELDWCSDAFISFSDETLIVMLTEVYNEVSVPDLGFPAGYGDLFAQTVIELSWDNCFTVTA